MADDLLSFSADFDGNDEASWLAAVDKALKGRGPETLVRKTPGGLEVHPLYRESDFASSAVTGALPLSPRDEHLPWDIRQAFTHPDPAQTNAEILRDLERGVSSVEIKLDCSGQAGCSITDGVNLATALNNVRADIATVALDHGGGTGTSAAAILALWAEKQDNPKTLKLAFNIDPLGALQRTGVIAGGLDAAFKRCAALTETLMLRFPLATALRVDARPIHEAGGSEAQELGGMIAHGVDTLRRLSAIGVSPEVAASQIVFTLSIGQNYGLNIAKLRAARRLWSRCLEALVIEQRPMILQAVTSARMLTRYDPWVNMLRNSGACFAAAVAGADIVTVRPFTDALGVATELGRRIARNTQIIAMEESNLGRVSDPAGGAWFTETYGSDLAEAAWADFQSIEKEGGYGASLMADAFQARIGTVRAARMKDISKRKTPLTGVSEFPLLEEIEAPVAEIEWNDPKDGVSSEGLKKLLPQLADEVGEDAMAEPLWPIRLAEPFERLRDHAATRLETTGKRPSIFLATLGPLAEHNARLDFARNFFATGGINGISPPVPPTSTAELAAAFQASGCQLAVICGSDDRYEQEVTSAATALKEAGAQRVYLAGKHEADDVDSNIHIGVDVIHALELAHAELGITS